MPVPHRRWSPLALVLGLALMLVAAPSASARRDATRRQAAAIARAIQTTPVAGLRELPRSHYRVVDARVSTVSRAWATASLVARRGYEDRFQPGYVIAVQPAGTSRWVVVSAGSSGVGCGIAPVAVLRDLLGIRRGPVCPA